MNISVIIPVYNVEKFVERCILSIMKQTYTEGVECIVVNDCTLDNSMKIVERLVADYKGQIQFKLINHEHNKGLAAVRNTGLYAASGNYIIHIDSDDYCEPNMLEKMYTQAVKEDADIVMADYWDTWSDKEIYRAQQIPDINESYAKFLLQGKIAVVVWNKMIRRRLLIENGLNSIEGIDMGEDNLLIYRLFSLAPKVVHLPEAFLHYVHYNPNSYCQSLSRKSLNDIVFTEQFLIDFYTKAGLYTELQGELLKIRISNRLLLMERSRGKLQKKWNYLYDDISLKEVVKYSPTRKRLFLSLLAALHLLPMLNGLFYIRNKIVHSDCKCNVYKE